MFLEEYLGKCVCIETVQRNAKEERILEAMAGNTKKTDNMKKAAKTKNAVKGSAEALKKKKRLTGLIAGGVIIAVICVVIMIMWLNKKDDSASDSTGNFDASASYYAEINIKDYGTVTVALDASAAPETVENFVSLAEEGFYENLTFHRIMEGFMMQGGDPNGDGTGGSEKTITGEFADNGFENNLSHTRGAISMARSMDYDSASSQFFIVHEDSTFLDGQYAAFGYVTEGMDIVDEICESAEPIDTNGSIEKKEQPVIQSIKISKGEPAK